MALVLPVSYFNCHFRWFQLGGSRQSTFALAGQLNASTDPDVLAQDFEDAFTSNTGYDIANVYADWLLAGVHAEIMSGGGLLTGDSTGGVQGTAGATDLPPPNVAMLVQKRTSLAGRRFRGRMYFPAISLTEDDIDDFGNIDPTVQAVIATNVAAWITETLAISEVSDLFLLHDEDTPGPPSPTAITSFAVESLVATQRRRLR